MKYKKGTGMIFAGLLMLSAALFLVLYNHSLNESARESVAEAVAAMEFAVPQRKQIQPQIPETIPRAIREMPEIAINGQNYIGTLEIPSLDLTLGIISQWNEQRLQIAPCRYTGSIYTDDLVIAAHNYPAHFGKLKELQSGETVLFTDAEGVTNAYTVAAMEILMPENVEEMTDGTWDLTLFTCTYGGESRMAVRCSRSA